MKHEGRTFERIYEKDPKTGAFIISIALDQYEDVFNELDSAPWRKRDLDNDLRLFIEDCSSDIPQKYDIILQFNVGREKQDQAKEGRLKDGLKTYFTFVRSSLQKNIRQTIKQSIIYSLVAFFLIFAFYSLSAFSTDPLLSAVFDFVAIGGWVFLWEAISTLAFEGRGSREKHKMYQRFSTAEVSFTYKEAN